jgi:Cdc6-like AAA superfamily ATPase
MKLLKLRLSPGTKPNHVRVEGDGSGQYNNEFELPYTTEQLRDVGNLLASNDTQLNGNDEDFQKFRLSKDRDWMFEDKLLQESQEPNGRKFIASRDRQKNIGLKLFNAIFGGNVKNILTINDAPRHLHIQIYIDAIEPEFTQYRLHDYPWELVFDGQHFLAEKGVTFSRYITFGGTPPQRDKIPSNQPLNVLLVSAAVCDKTNGLKKLSIQERETLQKLANGNLNKISLKTLKSGTYEDFKTYLEQQKGETAPHVIHFDGHGFFGKVCPNCKSVNKAIASQCTNEQCKAVLPHDSEGYLVFEQNGNQTNPHYVSRVDLGSVLGDQKELRLVVLSACKSAFSRYSNSVFNGIAQNLISQNVPAVVAMQYSVDEDSAISFVKSFYDSLNERNTLPMAMHKGRQNMKFTEDQWYRPVLYLRWADNEGGQLFTKLDKHPEVNPEFTIDWHDIFRNLFEEKLNESWNNNSVLNGSDKVPILQLDISDNYLYQDIKLAEINSQNPHKNIQKKNTHIDPKDTSNATNKDPETEGCTLDKLFAGILSGKIETQKSQGKRIAILGEPGSGKTVGLLRIAQLILESQDSLPVMVDLKQINVNLLQTKGGLKQYLYETLQSEIFQDRKNISVGDIKARFKKLVSSGKVWLLLDGVNEISYVDVFGSTKNQNVFDYLHDELDKDWINIKVVLTCRLNEWESSEHSLKQDCDTFRLSRYEDSQINKYINRRFKGDKTKIDGLIADIDRHPHLKDLAKNPLRLAMLCFLAEEQTQFTYSSLTKANLYEKLVEKYSEKKISSSIPPETINYIHKITGNSNTTENLTRGEKTKLLKCINTNLARLSLKAMEEDSPLSSIFFK